MSDVYINFWRKPKETPKFTDMELALMEGGHSLEEPKNTYSFIKELTKPTLGPLVVNGKRRPGN